MAGNQRCRNGCNANLGESRLLYRDDERGLLGFYCKRCGSEWLRGELLPNVDAGRFVRVHDRVFLLNLRDQAVEVNFNVVHDRTLINTQYGAHTLKVADQISWEGALYAHHAIIESVADNIINVIEYQKINFCSVEVKRNAININDGDYTIYRIDYDAVVVDPDYLTLARARAWLGQTCYNLFTRNCESFAVYCKIGALVSWQSIWFLGGVMRCIYEAVGASCWRTGFEIFLAEIIERSGNFNNAIGAGIVFAIEGIAIVIDVRELYNNRTRGGISQEDFVYNIIKRVIEGITMAGFVVAGGIAGQALGGTFGAWVGGALGTLACPGVGTAVGMFIGSVIGGVVLGVPGYICGKFIGSVIGGVVLGVPGYICGKYAGRVIGALLAPVIVPHDSRATRFEDLRNGDHISRYVSMFHWNCHAIIVNVNRNRNQIEVVTKRGNDVVRQWVDFDDPVYKYIYTPLQRRSVNDTIARALSRVGLRGNMKCKQFALWCVTQRHA